MIPVQEPVLTAHTKVFSSPEAVAVFSTLVAIAALFDELNLSPIHAALAQASSSDQSGCRLERLTAAA